jgi:hypothetical protein
MKSKEVAGVIETSRVFGIYDTVTSISADGIDDKKGQIFLIIYAGSPFDKNAWYKKFQYYIIANFIKS